MKKCNFCGEEEDILLFDRKAIKDEKNVSYHTVYVDVRIYYCRSCNNVFGDVF